MNIRSTQRNVKQTPYRRILNSRVGTLVRENKVATGAAAVAGTAVTIGGAWKYDGFARVAQYGLVPAVGAGISVLGAAAVHDAVVNDLPHNKLKATTKIVLGTSASLGGAQMVGLAYNVPVLDEALTGLVFDHGQSVLGAGLISGAGMAGKAAIQQFSKASSSENKLGHLALGTGAAVGSVGAGLAGAELLGRDLNIPVMDKALSGTIEFLAETTGASVVGGALLMGGAAVAGTQALKNLSADKNEYATAAMVSGAAAGGLGGLEMLGHGLGLEATQGLFTDNADVVGSLSLSAAGAAVSRHAAKSMGKNGLTPVNTGMMTAGASATIGGLGLAAASLGAHGMAALLSNGTSVAAGVGLGLSTVAFGKSAVDSAKKGRVGSAIFHGAGAAASATGSLAAVGNGLGIEALESAATVIYDATLAPLGEHVVGPSLEFLVKNPVIGGVGLVTAVGIFAYVNMKD